MAVFGCFMSMWRQFLCAVFVELVWIVRCLVCDAVDAVLCCVVCMDMG